jgi:inorganic triphosphatase YgiF
MMQMEPEQVTNAIHELAEFATTTGRTLANHRAQLQRHEEILHAEYKAGVTHHDAIAAVRQDVKALGDLVDSQSQLIQSMQRCLIKILTTLGLPTPEEPTRTAPN